MDEPLSPAMELARNRIDIIRSAAKQLSIATGGDQAECAIELICAAALIIHEAHPMAPVGIILEDLIDSASKVVDAWFADEIQQWGRKHG